MHPGHLVGDVAKRFVQPAKLDSADRVHGVFGNLNYAETASPASSAFPVAGLFVRLAPTRLGSNQDQRAKCTSDCEDNAQDRHDTKAFHKRVVDRAPYEIAGFCIQFFGKLGAGEFVSLLCQFAVRNRREPKARQTAIQRLIKVCSMMIPKIAIASSPAVRETALLIPEATPTRFAARNSSPWW